MPNVDLVVSVNDAYKNRLSEVAEDCKKAGMKIDQQMDSIGIITGSIDSTKVRVLKQLRGVSRVEPSAQIRIAPPSGDIR